MKDRKLLMKFQKIYNETYSRIYGYVMCKCDNSNDIDDIVQETYLELYKRLVNKKRIINYEAYIITIAKNKVYEYFNRHKKDMKISLFQESNNEEFVIDLENTIDIEEDYITKENISYIWEKIKEVDVKLAKIFYLHIIVGMSFKEVAQELNIKEATTKTIFYRKLEKIRNYVLEGERNVK